MLPAIHMTRVDADTENDWVNVLQINGADGHLLAWASCRNSHATNSMQIRTTVIDDYDETTDSVTQTILPLALWKGDGVSNVGSARAPYREITVDVKSLLADLHCPFRFRSVER